MRLTSTTTDWREEEEKEGDNEKEDPKKGPLLPTSKQTGPRAVKEE